LFKKFGNLPDKSGVQAILRIILRNLRGCNFDVTNKRDLFLRR
jgi:hypothetical protein